MPGILCLERPLSRTCLRPRTAPPIGTLIIEAPPHKSFARSESTPVLDLAEFCVRFGKREILRQLTVTLRGRVIGLLGPNGAGKSTLIQTLLGFCPSSGGTARVLGHDIRAEMRAIRTLVGYMPENDSFIANLSAVSFVRMMGEISGLPPEAALERAHEVLFYVGWARPVTGLSAPTRWA